jgi:hypothetical protein
MGWSQKAASFQPFRQKEWRMITLNKNYDIIEK